MRKQWTTIVVALCVMMGCSGIRVAQDYDTQTRFDDLQSYRWATATQPESGDPRIDNPLRDTRIRAAVERVLAEKGFNRSQEENWGFLIRYQYTLRQKIESTGTSSGIGFGYGRRGRYGGVAIGTGDSIRQYDEGTLVIDFQAAASGELLWRGTGIQRFRQYDDPAKTTSDINQLVEKILGQFPPQ